jgi:hypothetical protein
MAKIEDLVAQIPDERLKKAIGAEVRELKKNKKFGLVFEEHLPETVRLGRKYECVQLYKSYLENFRINTQDALSG